MKKGNWYEISFMFRADEDLNDREVHDKVMGAIIDLDLGGGIKDPIIVEV